MPHCVFMYFWMDTYMHALVHITPTHASVSTQMGSVEGGQGGGGLDDRIINQNDCLGQFSHSHIHPAATRVVVR